MLDIKWIPVSENEPSFTDFVWIMSEADGVCLAHHYVTFEHKQEERVENHTYQTAYTVGDYEGLHAEYYDDVTHWAHLEYPEAPEAAQ
jgi:hypothetical protein